MASSESIHVFIDNSNVFGGAQNAAKTHESHAPWQTVRVYLRNLVQLVEDGRTAATRVLAGSVPPGNDDLWEHAKKQKYNTDLLKRVASDDGRMLEQGVDELLHLKIANAVLDNSGENRLVIVTGDGKVSGFGTSFPAQAERALKAGWKVEVWSWKNTLSRQWRSLANRQKKQMSVHELDPFYFSITFIRAGSVVQPDGSVVHVADRVVSKLPTGLKIPRT